MHSWVFHKVDPDSICEHYTAQRKASILAEARSKCWSTAWILFVFFLSISVILSMHLLSWKTFMLQGYTQITASYALRCCWSPSWLDQGLILIPASSSHLGSVGKAGISMSLDKTFKNKFTFIGGTNYLQAYRRDAATLIMCKYCFSIAAVGLPSLGLPIACSVESQ